MAAWLAGRTLAARDWQITEHVTLGLAGGCNRILRNLNAEVVDRASFQQSGMGHFETSCVPVMWNSSVSLGIDFEGGPEKSGIYREMAEREGFEPSIRGYRIHTFQACSFNHSDTSP